MATSENSSCSQRLNRFLYSVCTECIITILTLIDVLAITAELLIRLEILQISKDNTNTSSSTNVASSKTLNGSHIPVDPGGHVCVKCHVTSDFGNFVCTFHYISICIAGIFFIEVLCRLVSGPKKFCKRPDQIIDGFVVLLLVTMEILFTVFWSEVLCYHGAVEAATYLVIVRVIRIPKACTMSKERYAEKMDLATHYLRECKLKSDEENKQYQRTIKNQEEQIENLKKQILRYEIENTKGEYTQKRSEEDNPVSGNGHIPNRHQIEENIQISPNHVTKVEVAKVKQGNIPENNAQTKIPNGVSKLSNKTREPVHDSIDNLNKDQDVTDGVQEYEQGTGEFIPVLDNTEGNMITTNNDSSEKNADNYMANKHKKLTKSVSEGSGFNSDSVDNNLPRTNSSKDFSRSSSVDTRHVHDIVAQIESYSNVAKLKRKHSDKEQLMNDDENDSALGADNMGLDIDELDEVQRRNLPVMAEYEGTRTYRSAEGIPLTDL